MQIPESRIVTSGAAKIFWPADLAVPIALSTPGQASSADLEGNVAVGKSIDPLKVAVRLPQGLKIHRLLVTYANSWIVASAAINVL